MEWPEDILELVWGYVRAYVRPRMMRHHPLSNDIRGAAAKRIATLHGVGAFHHYYEHPVGHTIPLRTCVEFAFHKYDIPFFASVAESDMGEVVHLQVVRGLSYSPNPWKWKLDLLWNNIVGVNIIMNTERKPTLVWEGDPPWFWGDEHDE